MADNLLSAYRFGPDRPTPSTRAGMPEGMPQGEMRSALATGDQKVADLMASTGMDYRTARTLAEALGIIVPAAAAYDAGQGAAQMATGEKLSPGQAIMGGATIGMMAHPLTRRLSPMQKAGANSLFAYGASGDDPLAALGIAAGAYGGQAAGKAVESAGRAAVGAVGNWANARTPNAADIVGSRAANEVSGVGGPSMPAVTPGRDLSRKIPDELNAAKGPRLTHDRDAWASQPYHEYKVQGPRAVVRRETDPASVAEREQFREGHVLQAQRRMVEEKAARAQTPGTPEYFEYQAALDAKRVEELGKRIGGEQFRKALAADPKFALDTLSQQTGRSIPELAEDFARLGLDLRNFDARIMTRKQGKVTGEMQSPYDMYNNILRERFTTPPVTSKKPRGKTHGEDY